MELVREECDALEREALLLADEVRALEPAPAKKDRL